MKKIWSLHIFFIALTVIGAISTPILKFEINLLNFLAVLGFLGFSFSFCVYFGFNHLKKEPARNILKSEYQKELEKEFEKMFFDVSWRLPGTIICFVIAYFSSGFLFIRETSVDKMCNFFYNQDERQVFIYFVFAWITAMLAGCLFGETEYNKKIQKT